FSTVGLSAVHGQARFVFGQPELFQGISFIPAMIGLFGLSEVLRGSLGLDRSLASSAVPAQPRSLLGPAISMFPRRILPWIRSSSLGALIGILPGAGADI